MLLFMESGSPEWDRTTGLFRVGELLVPLSYGTIKLVAVNGFEPLISGL